MSAKVAGCDTVKNMSTEKTEPTTAAESIPDDPRWAFESYSSREAGAEALLASAKTNLPELEELLAEISGHWTYEDMVYRFYHQSFKVYALQGVTQRIVKELTQLCPEGFSLNEWFLQIVADGTGRVFEMRRSNDHWLEETRPIVEAFMHAKFFLEMVVRYAKELDEAPRLLPSGWAAVLYLYDLR